MKQSLNVHTIRIVYAFKMILHCFLCITILSVYLPQTQAASLNKRETEIQDGQVEVANNCHCVEYYLCDEDNYIIENYVTIFNVRLSEIKRTRCSGTKFCCKKRPKTNGPVGKQCGVSIINPNDAAVVAEITVSNWEFPWIASVFHQLEGSNQYRYKCSGTLIHPQVVLTTSTCFQRLELDKIRIVVNGENELNLKISSESFANDRKVSLIVQHPEFHSKSKTRRNDLALLFLNQPYNISTGSPLNVLCLPPQNYVFKNPNCMVAGGGELSTSEATRKLKKFELPLVGHQLCQEQLRKTMLGDQFELHDSFVCAGGSPGRPEPCRGDGGSPLMCQMNNSYYQAGILSWGVGCNQNNVPNVFTDVTKYHDWIFAEITKHKFNM